LRTSKKKNKKSKTTKKTKRAKQQKKIKKRKAEPSGFSMCRGNGGKRGFFRKSAKNEMPRVGGFQKIPVSPRNPV
jgi:ribosome assembly protein YihI (activator of Der GTPase)